MLTSLVAYIVKTVVENPEEVQISQVDREGQSVLRISVNKNDIGRVIGKDGQTIKAIRALVFAVKGNNTVDDVVVDD